MTNLYLYESSKLTFIILDENFLFKMIGSIALYICIYIYTFTHLQLRTWLSICPSFYARTHTYTYTYLYFKYTNM